MNSLNRKCLGPASALIKSAQIVLVLITLSGCGGDDAVQDVGADQLFDEGQEALLAGNYVGAISSFQNMIIRYPFNENTKQAQLGILYAFYKSNQPDRALDIAETFIRENPRAPEVAYCLYMTGVIRFDSSPNFIERLFRVDITERPPDESQMAFDAFQDLIRQFPDSVYVDDARQRMVFLRNRLAKYQNHVANYYLERGAYVAAANRARYAIEHYPGAPELEESLEILVDSYSKLGMNDLAADARRVLAENFGELTVAESDSER
jgi:outer membrane protein assembly factor BamD